MSYGETHLSVWTLFFSLLILCFFPPLYVRLYILHHFIFRKGQHKKDEEVVIFDEVGGR